MVKLLYVHELQKYGQVNFRSILVAVENNFCLTLSRMLARLVSSRASDPKALNFRSCTNLQRFKELLIQVDLS